MLKDDIKSNVGKKKKYDSLIVGWTQRIPKSRVAEVRAKADELLDKYKKEYYENCSK